MKTSDAATRRGFESHSLRQKSAAWITAADFPVNEVKTAMRKVIIIGCPGSGKTTFSRHLARITGLPLYHLDSIWHKLDRTNISKEDFVRRVEEIMTGDQWILDGNYGGTMETRLRRCDTVFLLDYPLEICLQGVRDRIGKPRPEMPWIEEEMDPEFRAFIESFPQTKLPHIYALLRRYGDGRQVIVFKSRGEADVFLKRLENVT